MSDFLDDFDKDGCLIGSMILVFPAMIIIVLTHSLISQYIAQCGG